MAYGTFAGVGGGGSAGRGPYYGGYGGGVGGSSLPVVQRTSPPSRAPSAVTPAPSTIPQLPYQPEAPRASGMVQSLQRAGEGLLDPNSPYSKKLMESIMRGIGQASKASQRAATLDAIRGGFGSGQSAELLESQSDIARGGEEAMGEAAAGMYLGAPELGGRLLSPALSGEIGLQGQRLSGFLSQQELQSRERENEIRNRMEADRMAQEAMLREFSLLL